MKLAWICYEYKFGSEEYETPVILFVEPERWQYSEIIPIVYAMLEGKDELHKS